MTDGWSGWTPELTKTASDMWTAGKSATQIGMVLGCNRNIVMGKMHRMGVVSGSGLNLHNVRPPKLKASKTPVLVAAVKSIPDARAKTTKGETSEHPKPATMPTGQGSQAELRVGGSEAAHPLPSAGSVTSVPRAATTAPAVRLKPSVSTALICRPIDITELDDGRCRWPIGDPLKEGFGYCGGASGRKRYCAFHTDIGTNPDFRRRRGPDGA